MGKYHYKRKLMTLDNLLPLIKTEKDSGGKVVFTNGCFDVIHKGHVDYLRKSRELGDCLIVGLNSDSSVRSLKGKSRPFNSELDRACVLESFDFIDYVVIFHEETPVRLIAEIQPDYYTKSGDYSLENILGSGCGSELVEQYGGTVVLMDHINGYSTTSVLSKMEGAKYD